MNVVAIIALLVTAEPDAKTWLGLMVVPGGQGGQRCALVVAVAQGGPASGRVSRGDCVAEVDGHPVTDAESFSAATRMKRKADIVVLRIQDRLVALEVGPRPDDAFAILCEERKRANPRVRIAFDGRKLETEFPVRATIADARKAINAPRSARAILNPRVRCDETATPVVVDAAEELQLENDDSVVFLRANAK